MMGRVVLSNVRQFFSVPCIKTSPDLIKAQFEVMSRQLPLMYSTLLINAWILVSAFWGHAPLWLTLYIPIVFTLACGARLYRWWRSRHSCPSVEKAHAALVQINRLSVVLSVFIVGWALMLYPYGDYGMQSNVVFFMSITGICIVICLMHFRSAAFIVWGVLSTAFFLHFVTSGVPSFVAMAINMPFVSAALLSMVYVQSKYFSNSVNSQKRLEIMSQENLRLANIDSLTGLSNRRAFFSLLEEAVSDAQFRQQRVTVGIVDLDGFKSINDLYGHAVGDKLLIEVGRRLETLVDDGTLVCRLGGDEFALLVEADYDDATLLDLGERLCANLSEQMWVSDVSVQISASVGFAVYPDLADCTRTLYERADYAQYNCKRRNRGNAALFSCEQVTEIEHMQKIEAVLRAANLDAELSTHFQPIMDVASEKPVGFEALARWENPELGMVPPFIFIPLAERTGMIGDLTQILLKKALTAAKRWPETMKLSFNLSNHDIGSQNGVDRIADTIRASGIDPARIVLEITETAVMGDLAQAEAAIKTLKSLGCGIALDDFGTGFSSLSQLHALPLDKIKIDRSFVSDLHEKPASYKIVKSLLTLSKDMGLECVTEGVETESERAVIAKLGGTMIQGYFYSKPLTQSDAEDFLARHLEAEPPLAAIA